MNKLPIKRVVLFLAFCLAVIVIQLFNWYSGIDASYWYARIHEFHLLVNEWYWVSVCAYMSIFIGATIFAIPITVFLTVIGGVVFGFIEATFYAVSAATIGSGILFLLVRHGIGIWIQNQYRNQLGSINKSIELYGAYYVALLQLFPFTPSPLITISAGLSTMPLTTFIIATAVGIFPGTLVYVWFAEQLVHYTGI